MSLCKRPCAVRLSVGRLKGRFSLVQRAESPGVGLIGEWLSERKPGMNRWKVGLLGVATAGMSVMIACSGDSGGSSNSTEVLPPVNDTELMAMMASASVGTPMMPADESDALVELGRALFFDKILSGNQDISCGTCHQTAGFTSDAVPVSIGVGGHGALQARRPSIDTPQRLEFEAMHRNSPSIFNADTDDYGSLFWDGKVVVRENGDLFTPQRELNDGDPVQVQEIVDVLDSKLAALAMFPVTPAVEMRGRPGENPIANLVGNVVVWEALTARLIGTNNGTVGGIQEYRDMFQAAYPNVTNFDDFNFGHAGNAMRAFIRDAFTSLDSPYDQYLAGDMNAMTESQKRGAELFFGDAKCSTCHNGPHLSDFGFYNLAMPQVGPGTEDDTNKDDFGLFLRSGNFADRYKFRTAPLRNVALTAPYTHSGAYPTLRDVIEHHLDPVNSAENYTTDYLPELYRTLYFDTPARIQARISRLAPEIETIGLSSRQIDDLVAFMHALTDPNVVENIDDETPETVPSGLPVAD